MSDATTMTAELQILTRARELVAAGWCQGESARDKAGAKVSALSSEACSFCSLGALNRADDEAGPYTGDSWNRAASTLRRHAGEAIALWNDRPGRTQAEVLVLFDRAIADAQRAAQ